MKDMDDLNDEIWVNEFTEESAREFRHQLIGRSALNRKAPIVVYIDSYGGYADSLATMIEAMDSVPNPIATVCHGKAMSCGAILLSHGDLRFIGPHSRVMVHEVSAGVGGNIQDMVVDLAENVRLNNHFMGLLANNCDIKGGAKGLRKLVNDNGGREIYLDAAAAVKFGIADAVGSPAIEINPTFELSLIPPKRITVPAKGTKKASTSTKTKKRKSKS